MGQLLLSGHLRLRTFEAVKGLIVDSPALALFDTKLSTIVTTEALDYGLGGALTQIHPDNSLLDAHFHR